MDLQRISRNSMAYPIDSLRPHQALIQDIQQRLNWLGFAAGTPDGSWGPRTQAAYTAFAQKFKLNDREVGAIAARFLLQAQRPANQPVQPVQPTPPPQPQRPIPQPPQPTQPTQPPQGQRPTPQPPQPTQPTQPQRPTPQPPQPQPGSNAGNGAPSKTLTARDYEQVAQMLGCEVAAVRAVVEVESSGSGFLNDGRPKILFEAHWFSEFTNSRFDSTHPDISSPRWNKALYKGGTSEWPRLDKAASLNREAALKSASWGLGQVMGFNFRSAGYPNVEAFVKDMYVSEGRQMAAMFNFIRSLGLSRHLVNRNWQAFALGYNGEGYRQNRYDEKLAAAYQRWRSVA